MEVTALRVGEWTPAPDGDFRVLVIDQCPTCKVKEVHALETFDDLVTKCLVCLKTVTLRTKASATPPTTTAGGPNPNPPAFGFEFSHRSSW